MEEQHTEMATRLERMTAAFKAERERRKEAEEKLYVSVLEEEEEKDNGEEEGRGEEVVVTRITLSLSHAHTLSHTHTLTHTLTRAVCGADVDLVVAGHERGDSKHCGCRSNR